ncbi:Uncharacterized protein ChrSV_2900 [Chromobacterium vaccinii]|nr:Uncharacterized protein ChrSW_2900 [Chromobacterium vaccinii]QND90357.1 Uncharacterized protein ChrSV_2900 [Chromobacterium vaccinii]
MPGVAFPTVETMPAIESVLSAGFRRKPEAEIRPCFAPAVCPSPVSHRPTGAGSKERPDKISGLPWQILTPVRACGGSRLHA